MHGVHGARAEGSCGDPVSIISSFIYRQGHDTAVSPLFSIISTWSGPVSASISLLFFDRSKNRGVPPFSRCPDTLPFVPLFCEISRPRDARQPTVWNYSVRDLELFSAFIWEVTRLLKERFLYEPGLSGKEFLCLEGDRSVLCTGKL